MTSPADLRVLQFVDTVLGAGRSLESLNTQLVMDRGLVAVAANNSLYMLRREATDAPSGTDIVQPSAGPGRWFLYAAGGAGGGGVRLGQLTLASGTIVATGVNAGLFVQIDAAGSGSYSQARLAPLFEPSTGLAVHYLGSDDLVVMARLTVTAEAGSAGDWLGALALGIGDGISNDTIGNASSQYQQQQNIVNNSGKRIFTCERLCPLNSSSSSRITAALCLPSGGYGSDIVFDNAMLTLVY